MTATSLSEETKHLKLPVASYRECARFFGSRHKSWKSLLDKGMIKLVQLDIPYPQRLQDQNIINIV